jgi:hypothetical protein
MNEIDLSKTERALLLRVKIEGVDSLGQNF